MAATKFTYSLFVLLFACLALLGCSGGDDDTTPDPNQVRPSITGLSTNSAGGGDQLVINGIGFGNSQSGSSASLNGTDFTVLDWSDTQITVQVGAGMTSGIVMVTVGGLSSQSGTEAQLFIPSAPTTKPLISAVSPDYGYAGEAEILITGSGFGNSQGTGGVFFSAVGGTAEAEIVTFEVGGEMIPQWTNSSIKVIVPATAISGPVYVMANAEQSNTRSFTILPPGSPPGGPVITQMDPTSGGVGTVVTFTGDNFGHTQGSSTIKITGVGMDVVSWANTQIVALVPEGSATGSVRITVAGNFVESASFTVANPPEITGISPQTLKIGNPVTLYGKNFGFDQGTGKLTIGSSNITPTTWTDNKVTVDSLPSINFQDADAIPVTLTADNSLSDTTTVKLGTNLTVTVQATPDAGEAGSTEFSFFVAVNGGSGSYTYSLLPDASSPNSFAPETQSSPVMYTYPLNAVTEPTTFETRMKVVDNSNGDTAFADGPEIFIVPSGTPVIISIELQDFNNGGTDSPRNPWVFLPEPPALVKELYHDFTFFGGETIFASGLSQVSDGVNPVSGTTRVLRNFKSGNSLPRPYGYRYSDGDGRGSVVRINGINLGDTASDIYLNSDGPSTPNPGTQVPMADIISWTSSQIDFYLPANIDADLSGSIVLIVDTEEVRSSSRLICSPYIKDVQPDPVDQLGSLTLTGFDFEPTVVPGISGDETYLMFMCQATYDDPFGGGTVKKLALITRPYLVPDVQPNLIQIQMPDLGGAGPVEVYNNDFTQAQVVNGTYDTGTWFVWVWSGANTETGTNFAKAHSGIFSQAVEFEVSGGAPPPPGP
jgi:hypothetical protein